MWIERLEIGGFGRLRGEFDFAPGLTLISGPNEAGKSTLHQALMRSLFGFERLDRRRRAGGSVLQRWSPWGGAPYGVTALIHRGGERLLRASWSFDREGSTQALRLIDERTGEDLTAEVAEGRGEARLGRYLLGLDYAEFCQVCMLEQASIGAVERSDTLVESLRRAAEMGASEVGVEHATELIDAALGGPRIGVRRDTLAPLARGALAEAREREAELRAEVAAAEQVQAELAEVARRLDHARRGERAVEGEHLIAEQTLLAVRLRALDTRIDAAERSREQASYEPDPARALSPEAERRAREALAELDRREREEAELRPRADAAAERVRPLEAEALELETTLRRLAPYERVDTSGYDRVQGLAARIEELAPQAALGAEETEAERGPVAAGVGTAAGKSEGERAATGVDAVRRRPRSGALALAVLVALASLAGAALVSPLALVGLALAALIAYLGSRGGAGAPVPAPAAGGERPGRARSERRGALTADLAQALDASGADPVPDPLARAHAYLETCRRRRDRDEIARRHGELRAEIAEADEPVRRLRELEPAIRAARAAARESLGELGIGVEDLGIARAELERLAGAAREERRSAERAEHAREALDTALGGLSLDGLGERRDRAAERLRSHRAAHGELAPPTAADEQETEARVEDLARRLGDARAERARLEGLVSDRERALEGVPALREELAALEQRIERIGEAAEALRIAREALGEAATRSHRRFAPVLNEAIASDLPRITAGRYSRARVDENLAITLDAPETGEPVAAELLSRGTQDQIYLVERLAILRMLDTGDELAPLLLDDVFVHFDEDRLGFALEQIAREAAERQVLIFADEERIATRLDALGVEHSHLRLEVATAPSPPVASAARSGR